MADMVKALRACAQLMAREKVTELSELLDACADRMEIYQTRVLTLEEADDADVVWLEQRKKAGTADVRRVLVAGEQVVVMAFGCTSISFLPLAGYGKTWRCWNQRPTLVEMAGESFEVADGLDADE